MNNLFISFEGGEGSGKTTHINLLYEYLKGRNLDVLLTKEPGGSNVCQKIKNLILSKDEEKLAPMAELFLYLADRAHHVETVIRPALNAKQIVICDRYRESTLAYQGYGRKLNIDLLEEFNNMATGNLYPDITFLLDIDPAIGRKRIKSQRGANGLDRMELEALKFHRQIRNGFLELAAKYPQRIRVIDSTLSIEEIHNIIKESIIPYIEGTIPIYKTRRNTSPIAL